MDDKRDAKQVTEESLKKGQGFNNARGEIDDKKDIPKGNGLNVDNDPSHHRANEPKKA